MNTDTPHKLQIIYSTEQDGQLLANFPLHKYMLKSKTSIIDFATSALAAKYAFVPDGWQDNLSRQTIGLPEDLGKTPKLVKLSLCIIVASGKKYNSPAWYSECKGKLNWDDLHPNEPNPFI